MTIKEIDKYVSFIISIGKYLSHFYNVNSENANKLSHEAFMEIFRIKGLAPKEINLEDVISGHVILVSDTYDRVFGYKNPLLSKNDAYEEKEENADLSFDDNGSINLAELKLENLSDYELDQLLTESKKIKDERAKHRIIKELRFRPESKPGAKQTLIERVRKREFKKIKKE